MAEQDRARTARQPEQEPSRTGARPQLLCLESGARREDQRAGGERALRVLIAASDPTVAWGLRLLLDDRRWVRWCVVADDGQRAAELARRAHPDVALVDCSVGSEHAGETCARLRRACPGVRIVLIVGPGRVPPAVLARAGAVGVINKRWSGRDMAVAIRLAGLRRTYQQV